MLNRNYTLDYIRVFAIALIIICHYLEYSGVNEGLGRYTGRVGNMLFFLISALLYGQKMNGGGQNRFMCILKR